ncbi:aldose 1-epimerase family protein [Furfurilactobacillus milii]|uniref:Aldose 1-epimerase family protein n=1 Tax=Furfurilactobacillus milii TaxID=2888272 RepID=A0A6N9I0M4_9LACO|nr:aldose 1-epimerase family protein [Furfurilactobacillus milii]MYV16682.1 aldose 1-epimerase family protein [Furfurilactobacillus milii]
MIKLSNEELTVAINEHGAELTSVKDVQTHVEYMWQADKKFWGRHAPVLFPIVGRLHDDQYRYQDKTYSMTQHGFARDQDFLVTAQTATSVTFTLKDNDASRIKYPFAFQLDVMFSLLGRQLSVEYRVANPSDEPIYFSIGGHPGFNVPLGDSQGTFNDYTVAATPAQTYSSLKLDGPFSDVDHPTTLNFERPMKLNHDLFEHDAKILQLNQHPATLTLTSGLNEHGIAVTLQNADYVGVWSPYPAKAPFVCIEPWWGIADAVNADGDLTKKFGIHELYPQAMFNADYSIEYF